MKLELHDNETGDTLVARIKNIDFDYQAEMRILETYNHPNAVDVTKWILIDDAGVRCTWERKIGSSAIPIITKKSDRFTGEWKDPS